MKRNIILVLILFVLMAAYYLFKTMPKTVEFTAPSSFALDRWDSEQIDKISFSFNDQELVLKKQALLWTVNDFQVDDEKMKKLLDAVDAAEVTSKVSTNPENHNRFEIGDSAVTMKLYQNDELISELLLGKSAGGQSMYARLPGEDAVYILSGIPAYLISREVNLWRERSLIALAPDQTRSVAYDAGAGWALTNTNEGWRMTQGRDVLEVEESKVKEFLTKIANLQIADFVDDQTEPGALIGHISVEKGTADSLVSRTNFAVYRSNDDGKYQVEDESGNYYLITSDNFDQVFSPYTELREKLAAGE